MGRFVIYSFIYYAQVERKVFRLALHEKIVQVMLMQ